MRCGYAEAIAFPRLRGALCGGVFGTFADSRSRSAIRREITQQKILTKPANCDTMSPLLLGCSQAVRHGTLTPAFRRSESCRPNQKKQPKRLLFLVGGERPLHRSTTLSALILREGGPRYGSPFTQPLPCATAGLHFRFHRLLPCCCFFWRGTPAPLQQNILSVFYLSASASAALIKPRNSGCGRFGRLLNSGWNWHPTYHG